MNIKSALSQADSIFFFTIFFKPSQDVALEIKKPLFKRFPALTM